MAVPKIRSFTLANEGEVTLSPSASKQLGADKGARLIEVSTDNCVILLPENKALSEAMKGAREVLSKSGVTVEEVKAEVEPLKEERFARNFPDLAS